MRSIRQKLIALLSWSQRYTKTDMTYAIRGGFWILIGKAGILGVSFVTMTAFARWVPKEVYGTYQFVIAGMGIAGIFALSGMSTALVRSIAQNKDGTLILAVKEKMKWSLIGSVGLLIIALWYLTQRNIVLASGFALAAVFLPMRETFAISPVYWNGKKMFGNEAMYKILPAVLALSIIIPTMYLTDNVLWILVATLGASVFFDGLFLAKTIRKLSNTIKDIQGVSFGKNLTVMDAVVRLSGHVDKIILWHFLGSAQLAVYSFAQFPIKSLGSSIPIHDLALPKLGEKNIHDIKRGLLNKFLLLFLLSVPATLLIVVSAPLAYKIFFPAYTESTKYFQALALILMLMPFNLLSAALVSDVRKKELYIIRVGSSIIKIVLFFALAPFYGIWGIVWAILTTEIFRMGAVFYFFRKI